MPTDTKHLDTAIELLKNTGAARRVKGQHYSLTIMGEHGTLQTPRGKTMRLFYGDKEKMVQDALAALPPGTQLEVYES